MNVRFNLGSINFAGNGFDKHLAHFTTTTTEGRVVTTPDTDIPDEHKNEFSFSAENIIVEIEEFDMKVEAEICKDLLSFAGNMFCACLDYKKQQNREAVEELKERHKEIKDLHKDLEHLEKKYKEVVRERDQLKFRKEEQEQEVEALKEKYKVNNT